jgi:hypothetical protein
MAEKSLNVTFKINVAIRYNFLSRNPRKLPLVVNFVSTEFENYESKISHIKSKRYSSGN